ncbi:hypothetical protein AGABI2DRAFT_115351 [Agaricus bisporus var. bisporus H97]|uniref:hypothetical protein n=1 Tax=Agaricus bisporus var. bisporus (strain H97 / ATCC MYA-4626 / FGSC 10389) TaxID=936046 RepID=UPI00029F60DF|nr:hypothetical protein AGABI2DRAFT_115351 [Agaricus bisporus var. bisporus H97]EKV50294.1 hypothetical protein AGABI2DRAFT_115351 [Agaricus bisporus var. bisporus H97]
MPPNMAYRFNSDKKTTFKSSCQNMAYQIQNFEEDSEDDDAIYGMRLQIFLGLGHINGL